MEPAVTERILDRLIRFAFVFEPLTPRVITYYLTRNFGNWRKRGLISGYRAKTKRLGVFHYIIEVELELNALQASYILGHYFPVELKRLRRWSNV